MRCNKAGKRVAVLVWAVAALAGATAALAQDPFQQGLDAYLKGEYQTALEHWRPAAKSGDAVAAFNIGVLYAQGLGVATDPAEAVRWYRRSAHAGYANAQFNLGAAYYHGEGTSVNVAQAVAWWEKAAAQDHAEALYNLATLYRRGTGVQRDVRRAVSLFNRAASLGDTRAQQALADMGSRAPARAGAGTASSPAPGTDPAADDAAGQAATGGSGGSLAAENPEHWTVQVFAGTEKRAARRFASSHGLAGRLRIYQAEIDGKTWFKGIYGSFTGRAEAQAARAELAATLPDTDPWVRSFRAIQGEAIGDSLVPVAESSGTSGVLPSPEQPAAQSQSEGSSDPGTATASAERAAAPDEKTNAGAGSDAEAVTADAADAADADWGRLRRGQKAFNAQNYTEAFEAWRPLAEKGVAEAQYGIGFMYESGWGVDRDYDEAFRWYQRAAQQGHVKAQFNLGMLYRNGQGVAQNDALGLYWIQTAADRGDQRAVSYLNDLN